MLWSVERDGLKYEPLDEVTGLSLNWGGMVRGIFLESSVPEIWVDLSCPWCFGALPVMQNLLKGPVFWRFVRLRPWPSNGAVCAVDRDVVMYNKARGCLVAENPDRWLPHPDLAHRLLSLAQVWGLEMWSVTLAAWTAWWQLDQDLSDLATLQKNLGSHIPQPIWEALATGGGRDLVEATGQRAKDIALDGVPRIFMKGQIIPAWHDADQVASRLAQDQAGRK
jgi:predicted DsbA family dithiol-disulfide isomerase